jgi:YVTN family beta-propeller protein
MVPKLRWIASIVGLWAGVAGAQGARPVETVPGMPPVPDPTNLYSEIRSDKMSPAVAGALPRIYVPNRQGNDVTVIDPATMKVVDRFAVGINPQHVVPSWDLKTLWVTNNAEGRPDGSLTPIDPATGKPGKTIMVEDPYNMYFTPDGKSAIVVAEALKRLDFRDPHTMAMQYSIEVPQCRGINHADFSIDGRIAIFTCEFQGSLARIDLANRKVLGYLKLSRGGMPQDIRSSPDGSLFFVVSSSWTAPPSPRPPSSRPASAPTACIRAATAPSSTWPTAAPRTCSGRPRARGASR